MSLHPKEQWFTIFNRSATEFGPREGEPAHTWHPDFSHPLSEVRRLHHDEARRNGVVQTACGKSFDPILLTIEEGRSEDERCADCLTALIESNANAAGVEAEVARRIARQVDEAAQRDGITLTFEERATAIDIAHRAHQGETAIVSTLAGPAKEEADRLAVDDNENEVS